MKKLNPDIEPLLLFATFEFATPAYDASVRLRHDLLRAPLKLEFTKEQLAEEWKDIHLGCFDAQDELLACLILSPQADGAIKMRQVAVREDLHGKGIGKKLVIASEALARDLGYETMTLHARKTAVPFYEKLDYKKKGKQFKEVGLPHYKMEKPLP
jgi:predicted GNAT family N-acyltransferase